MFLTSLDLPCFKFVEGVRNGCFFCSLNRKEKLGQKNSNFLCASARKSGIGQYVVTSLAWPQQDQVGLDCLCAWGIYFLPSVVVLGMALLASGYKFTLTS